MEAKQAIDLIQVKLKSTAAMVNFNQYDNIELSDEETKIALYNAKREKAGKLAEKEYWKKVSAAPEVLKLSYDEAYSYYRAKLKSIIGKDFTLTDEQENIFSILCEHFTSNEDEKGILLLGPVGCGKTTLMRVFTENQKASYAMVGCRKVTYDFALNGFQVVDQYSRIINGSANKFNQREFGFCFDDLGTEEERKNFGNSVNVMQDIILNRYDNNLIGFTHMTSNLASEQMKEFYGERALSRIREMFKIITFDVNAKDLRK